MELNNTVLRDKKKVALLYFACYFLFWVGGIIVCILIDNLVVKQANYRVTLGFVFTIPFMLVVLIATVAIYWYLWSENPQSWKLTKLKLTLFCFFVGRGFLYVLPILIGCIICFLEKDRCFFNIFSIFSGIMLSWIVNFATQLIFIQIDFKRMLKERSIRNNVVTGDSLKAN